MPNRLGRYCRGIMEACWLLALAVTPLYFDIYTSRVFEPDKTALVRSLALVALAAWLAELLSQAQLSRRPENFLLSAWLAPFVRAPFALPAAALVFVYGLANIFSVSPYISLLGSYPRLQGTLTTFSYIGLFAVAAAHLRRREQVDRLLTAAIIASVPVGLYALLQRLRLDPLPWGADTALRVMANMGNPIFLGAYLIMALFPTLSRTLAAYQSLLSRRDDRPANAVRAALYSLVLVVNLAAVWLSGSRGCWLGLLVGLFLFAVLYTWRARWRKLTIAVVAAAAVAGVFLSVLNVPGGPLENLRSDPVIGRLGRLLETEEGTGATRTAIWQGVVELVQPHEPLEYPDGRRDTWNWLRPVVGYGPETLYVTFNKFFPIRLAQEESRVGIPDRAHNEALDTLAITGVLGLLASGAVYVSFFYWALRWLGLIQSSRDRNLFLSLALGVAAVGALVLSVSLGSNFSGIGLSFGLLLGVIGFVVFRALRPAGVPEAATGQPGLDWRASVLIGLLTAAVAHFAELQTGIGISATRLQFWLFAAALLAVGRALQPEPAPALPARGRHRRESPASSGGGIWQMGSVGAGLMAAILVTLGFDYISNPEKSADPARVLVSAFTRLVTVDGARSAYGLLAVVVLAWLAGSALLALEESGAGSRRVRWKTLGVILGLSGLAGGLGWWLLSARLAAIAANVSSTVAQLLASVDQIRGLLALYAGVLVLVLHAWAFALQPPEPPAESESISVPRLLTTYGGFALLLAGAYVLSSVWNLSVIQADVDYKIGLQFDEQGRSDLAVPLFQRAVLQAPGQDNYYLFLGRAILNSSADVTDAAQRDELFAAAQTSLLAARRLNPLNPDHTANLARISHQWALRTSDADARRERGAQASVYYEQALRLSPNNVTIRDEWATLALQVIEDPDLALSRLDQSLQIDDTYDQTYLALGDVYAWQAQRETDAPRRQDLYQKAIAAYLRGLEHSKDNILSLRVSLGQAYAAVGQLDAAIAQYQQAEPLTLPANQWQIQRAIAELYRRAGDLDQARHYGSAALAAAPEERKVEVQKWLDTLSLQP
jgi:tetratricopeptide (TPR) repeat protein/O-antigen ligase